MKTLVIILLALVAATGSGFGQNLIAVQNGGTPSFYASLDSAIVNAQNGDTIYLPGMVYSYANSSITIDKELHLVGTGHYPNSSSATGITQLNASIVLITGADNSTFTGFYLGGNLFVGENTTNEDVDNITISRCYISNGIFLSRNSTNWLISESVIKAGIQGFYQSFISTITCAQNNLFSNNITNDIASFGLNNEFRNNIFAKSVNSLDGCSFKNNIFMYHHNNILSCKFENNIFFSSIVPSGSIDSQNIINQTTDNTFVNQTSDAFSYSQVYHLKSTSPGKNAGKDGTDIGIYGGIYPWKEGSIPFNPHFQQVQVSPKTDANGNLNVNIKVAAQER
jgi:hypothetical protein